MAAQRAAPVRVATMLHAGAPVAAPPAPGPATGSATVPAPPIPSGGEPAVAQGVFISIVSRESTNLGVAAEVPLTRRCTACETRYPADFVVCPRDASPLVDVAVADGAVDPLIGKLLGETYQIIRVIGEGGMGRVYEARHLRLKERRFAVKTLHSDLASNHEIVARFMREAESASSLSHPNVVDVFDVHHLPDGTPYFVGEFVEGEELATYVQSKGALPPRVAAVVGRQVCSALAAAHARGIVHRDMKPENIMLLEGSSEAVASGEVHAVTVKVLDFGISKAGGSERTHLTRTGIIMGTPSYMSPEQARGKPVDLRADIYSTGAVLYFALTGRRPFDSDDPTSTISMVLTQDPPRPRSLDPRIPEALELIVQKAMAKEARDRYQSMGELAKALAQFEDGGRSMVHVPVASEAPDATVGQTSAERAFDIAKRMFSTSPPGQSASLARVARPTITVASAVLGTWLVGGTTAALAGLVRVLHDGEITLTECVLLVVGCLFAAATPIGLYVLHVKKVIWPNSVRALQLASDLKRTATAALVTYGGLSIVARIAHTVLWRSSKGLASGWWDIVLFLVSVVAAVTVGGFAPLVRNMRRRRSS
jgi:serine/threonine-protein kinase